MRARLLIAPAWVQGAVAGLIAGLVSGSLLVLQYRYVDKETWPHALAYGAFFLVWVSVLMGVWMARLVRRSSGNSAFETLRALPPAARTAALRAASRGPVPSDSATRKAALHIASSSLKRSTRPRSREAVGFVIIILVGFGAALFITPWYWGVVVFILWMSGLELLQRRRLRRRVARLAMERQP